MEISTVTAAPAAVVGSSTGNAVQMFLERVRSSGPRCALRSKIAGAWRDITWDEWDRSAREIAAGLGALGVAAGDRVCILGGSRPEWLACDVGILMAGAVTVPIYHSNLAHECAYVMRDAGAKLLFAENSEQVSKALAERAGLPDVVRVVYFDERQPREPQGELTLGEVVPAETQDWVMSLAALRELGRARLGEPGRADALSRSWAELPAEAVFTIVYTSGTTGPPKGVVLTHANIIWEARALESILPFGPEDEQLLFLPLAHIFARALEWATIQRGARIAFAESIPALKANLLEIRPTFMGSVPRVLEKVYLGVLGSRNASSPMKQKIFDWAFSVGRRVSDLERTHRPLPPLLALQRALAHRLVFAKIHAALGGRLRFMVSGGAPLSKEIAEFFHAAGLLVCEGWGLTETSAGTTVNRPDDYEFGTVGAPVPGIEVRIAADGEILVRGGAVMRGYWNRPQDTADAIDAEGWFHTGDIGEFVGNKLKITDRKKDIIVNAGGKNIAPQNLENFLKATPYISQVMVHGDKRPYLVALVTLNEDNLRGWAGKHGLVGRTVAQLADDPQVRALIQTYIDQLNQREASYSSIKKFSILARDFSQETGELTPTLKVKRKVCYEKYRAVIDAMYGS